MSATTTRFTWHALPTELKLAVVESLDKGDVKSLSRVDQRTYQACVPALFKTVKLDTIDALEAFLENVPRTYLAYIENLDVCTAPANPRATPVLARVRSDFVVSLLTATPRLVALTLRISGTLDKSIIAPFPFLNNLRKLSMTNEGDEVRAPLSERLVVSIAFSIPHLTSLSLSRVTRSAMHAPDLVGTGTYVPLATTDVDIPAPTVPIASPTLSLISHSTTRPVLPDDTPLSLPTLLLMPTLKRLALKDTHLGDERWGSVTPQCRLSMLDLGACVHEEETFNSFCTARIVTAVGDSLSEVGIGSALGGAEEDASASPVPATTAASTPAAQPLAALRKLHISPYFPLERVVDTMSALGGSPVESVRIECFAEDVVDVCARVEEFLTLRADRVREMRAAREAKPGQHAGEDTQSAEQGGWFARLRTIWVGVSDEASAARDVPDCDEDDEEEKEERRTAARRLEALCADFKLGATVQDETPRCRARSKTLEDAGSFPVVCATRKGKGRAMTL